MSCHAHDKHTHSCMIAAVPLCHPCGVLSQRKALERDVADLKNAVAEGAHKFKAEQHQKRVLQDRCDRLQVRLCLPVCVRARVVSTYHPTTHAHTASPLCTGTNHRAASRAGGAGDEATVVDVDAWHPRGRSHRRTCPGGGARQRA